ncbi:hypothetical protein [Methanobrevibacter sp.]|uniref:hypothetical protein n=1 Tax=Methanobrevibacter sp. TaxID=66852 RepID=UPI00386B8C9D
MKLKNSHILLIVMTLFLLVSIGSVCASENATDADMKLADDGSDVVLADEDATTFTEKEKITTEIVSQDVKIKENATQKIDVTVKDNESKAIKITNKNLTVTEGTTKLNFTYKNSAITLSNPLAKGKHTLNINYLGNDVYKNSTKKIVLSVFGDYNFDLKSPTYVNPDTTKVELPIKVTNGVDTKKPSKDNFNVTISYKDTDGKTKYINISEFDYKTEKLIFNAQLVDNVKNYNMKITYKDNETKVSSSSKLIRLTAIKLIPLVTEADYQDGNFSFVIVDNKTNEILANKNISVSGKYGNSSIYWDIQQSGGKISLSTSKKLTTDSNGVIRIPNVNFNPNVIFTSNTIYSPVGTYELTFSGMDDLKGAYKTNIKIKKINSKITVNPFNENYGTTKKLTITVVNEKTGKPISGATVFFNMTDSNKKEVVFTTTGSNNTTVKVNTLTTNDKGTVELPMSGLRSGKYSVYALVNASSNNYKNNTKVTVTIGTPVKYTISKTGIITVKNKLTGKKVAGAYVIIKYDKNKNKSFYGQADNDGTIKIKTVGKHKITVSNNDLRYYGADVTKTITNNKITAKCSAPKVITYYKGDKVFTVKLTNSKKDPIYDAKLDIKLFTTSNKYYPYKGATGVDGQIRLSLESLNPGTYKVVITSGDTKNFALKKVTTKIVIKKAPAKLTPKKLTTKKGAKKYFKVTVKNTKTKKVIKGVKVKIKVYTGKKYKTYTVKTNAKGIANLNVKSLKVGTHKVVVSSGNKYVTAKAAKSTIKITKK